MRKYDVYKHSGVEWIDEIPAHWRVSKFKYISYLFTGDSLNDKQKRKYESENPEDIPYVSSKDINVDFLTVNYNSGLRIPRHNNPLKISPKGSFLMVVEGGSSGRKMVYLDQEVCFVNKLCSFRSKENTKFQYYFVQSENYQDKFRLSLSGLIAGVSLSNLRDFEISLPTLHEQKQIVRFLDSKTSLIDSLIEKTLRKIELLKEKRTSLISEAVTKGLNPNVEMKYSGLAWIGEIPEGWKVMTNKYFIISQKNKSKTGSEELLSVSEFHGVIPRRKIREGEDHLTRSESLKGYLRVKKGNLVSNIMLMWKKGLGVSKFEGIVSPAYSVFSFLNCEPKYYHYLFRTDQYLSEFRRNSRGIVESRLRLYDDSFGSLKSHFPTHMEQKQIVEYLDKQTQLIDKTISIDEKKIKLLKEFRQSIISEVVTGKRKVVA